LTARLTKQTHYRQVGSGSGIKLRHYRSRRWLDPRGAFWSAGGLKRQHKTLLTVGFIIFLAGWLAWSVLLTESELEEPPAAVQPS
ncbi:MAG: hypothetical protein ACRERC_18320, partial [Candidatus Binatia bacterium]